MAQANVAREPSMDEILASIRRIIESNDPPQAGAEPFLSDADEDAAEHDAGEDIHLTIEDAPGSSIGFEDLSQKPANVAFPLEDRHHTEPQAHAEPPLSLADVAARVRAASERHAIGREPEPRQEQPATRPMPSAVQPGNSPTVTARMGAAAPAARPAGKPVNAEVRDEHREPSPVAETRAAPQAEPKTVPANDDLAAVSSLPAIAEREVISLVSPVVGQKVAQSFESLALAVDEERRSFDEIAEEMLRPMLREWLDDNLPTLVERLVREEIERVARGPRR